MDVLAIVLALVGAVLFAFGTVLQQKGAMDEAGDQALGAGGLVRLARRPVWLAGVAVDGLGYACQAAALGVGTIVVVQPLLVLSVVFALPIGARLTGQRIGRREVLGAVAVVLGLVVFTIVSNPEGGKDDATDLAWIVGAAITGGAALALFLASRGAHSPGVRAALLGTSSGVLFGLIAALTKATVDRLDDGIVAVLADWHLYGLIGASVIAFGLMQAALATGALAPALSTIMVFETIVGVACGIWLLDEQLHEDAWGVALSVLALVVVLAGLVVLSRAQAAAEGDRPAEPAPTPAPTS